jgi:hypothetical protein
MMGSMGLAGGKHRNPKQIVNGHYGTKHSVSGQACNMRSSVQYVDKRTGWDSALSMQLEYAINVQHAPKHRVRG